MKWLHSLYIRVGTWALAPLLENINDKLNQIESDLHSHDHSGEYIESGDLETINSQLNELEITVSDI